MHNYFIFSKNTTHKGNEHYVPVEDAEKILENVPDDGEAEEISESGKVFYLSANIYAKL